MYACYRTTQIFRSSILLLMQNYVISAHCRSERRKSIVASAGVSTHSAGIGLEHGITTWDAAGVFILVVSTKVAGKSGNGAGYKTFTLYAGVAGSSGCWMTGTDNVGSLGRLENLLVAHQMRCE